MEHSINHPAYEIITHPGDSSFKKGMFSNPYFTRSLHYHKHYELLLIVNGFGKRLVGDHSGDFEKGDLVFIGENLPHAWISDPVFHENHSTRKSQSIFIQFERAILGSDFMNNPELQPVKKSLDIASRGIQIYGKGKHHIIKKIYELWNKNGLESLLLLLDILNCIDHSTYKVLASQNFIDQQFYLKPGKMQDIDRYLVNNFNQDISIKDCARHVNMSISSFCRFIKLNTRLTFSHYLNSIRLDFAQKLLINTNLQIKEIAYDCGFNSTAYFNKIFKRVNGVSPMQYRVKHTQDAHDE